MSDVSDGEFAALMAPLGPFGPAPRLAAAVSGGADSLALPVLAEAWARARKGSVLAHQIAGDRGGHQLTCDAAGAGQVLPHSADCGDRCFPQSLVIPAAPLPARGQARRGQAHSVAGTIQA